MKTNKAFTIIEAVMVFAIIAIVVSLGLVLYNNLSGDNTTESSTSDTGVVQTEVPAIANSEDLESVDSMLESSELDNLDDFSDLDAQLSQF